MRCAAAVTVPSVITAPRATSAFGLRLIRAAFPAMRILHDPGQLCIGLHKVKGTRWLAEEVSHETSDPCGADDFYAHLVGVGAARPGGPCPLRPGFRERKPFSKRPLHRCRSAQ